jgi:Putative peptidoglycan binding domain
VAVGSTATAIVLATQGTAHPAAVAAPAAAAPAYQVPAPVYGGSTTVHHTVVVPVRPADPGTHTHVVPKPPAQPSAAVETLQRELGALNYYEGPVTGYVNAQTTQAITYLQRDAHLPETGRMDAATTQALEQFLAHGNNQMGS